MVESGERVSIKSIQLNNYKALRRFTIHVQHLNIMVGPNNCGKSTIVGALRLLRDAIRTAKRQNPSLMRGPNGQQYGYRISSHDSHVSLENIHTNYQDVDTSVEFTLTNKNTLTLFFPADDGFALFADCHNKAPPRSPAAFRSSFPITIGIVPVLGPVEHEEKVLDRDTVRSSVWTHRAARHFRNYWYYQQLEKCFDDKPDSFAEFAELIALSWPGVEIQAPQCLDHTTRVLSMFCAEERIPRELFWAGFGFQVWCQLLTHIVRSKSDSVLVVDEPEIYLHPDVQRRLLGILRNAGPDIILATHSTEIIGEADPAEILLVDKRDQVARRLRDIDAVQLALDKIGSIQNITLTRLAKSSKVLFVEGNDFTAIRQFARKLGLSALADSIGITVIPTGGVTHWSKIPAFAWGIEKTMKSRLSLAVIFDRDFRSDEEIEDISKQLASATKFHWFHERKEIENYLLIPNAIRRALERKAHDVAKRRGTEPANLPDIDQLLTAISDEFHSEVQSQHIARYLAYTQKSNKDIATLTAAAIRRFSERWRTLEGRLRIVPGDQFMSKLNSKLQQELHFSVTQSSIIDAMRLDEIPVDMRNLLESLESFRSSTG